MNFLTGPVQYTCELLHYVLFMNPQKVTAQQLFTMQCRYLVPLYQRQYVWSDKDQLQPLWEDVLTKTHELLRPPVFGQVLRKHFMGAVVLRGLVTTGLEYQAFEVIDGQQRLTTLQLLLLALRDYADGQQFTTVTALLTGMTENPPLNGSEYERWKVVPTISDRGDYGSVWAAHSPQQLLVDCPPVVLPGRRRPEPRPRLVGTYEFFYQAIQQFAEAPVPTADGSGELLPLTTAERAKRVETLLQAITQRLELVRIDLDQDDDPQVIFETLNARGARLLPGDLVRNFLFLEATRRFPTQAEVEKLYATYWQQYDDTESAAFWKAEVRQGRLASQRFEFFLFHFLVSQLKRPDEFITLGYLYQAFIDWWRRDSGSDVAQVLALLQRYSGFYRRLVEPALSTDRLALFGRRLRTLDTSTSYPLLLFLFVERGDQTLPELDGILTDLESYLIRRLVCGLSSEGSNRLFQSMVTNLRQVEEINRQVVQQYLLALNGPTAEWPTNEQFRHRWLTSRAYLNLTKPRIRMILEAVEWQQYTKYQENARPFLDNATIEHILPQNPSEADWPLVFPPNAPETAREEAMLRRADLLHTFGNLTLVTQPLNSSLSNSAFAVKEKELSSQSILMLNRYFTLHSVKEWDEATILLRGEQLFEIADSVWPRPAKSIVQ